MSERKIRQNLIGRSANSLRGQNTKVLWCLTNAKLISSEEALAYISDVRLGVDMGIIKNLKPSVLNGLFIMTGPAYIQEMSKECHDTYGTDLYRADFIRQKMKNEVKS
jgi:protein arginine kinase